MNTQKKQNAGEWMPEAKSPKGGWSKFSQEQVDRYYAEQDLVIADQRVRRTFHQAGRYSINRIFI
jgi:hypothetical protein